MHRGLLLTLLFVAGCPHESASVAAKAVTPAPPSTEAELLAQKVRSLSKEVEAVVHATDEALWRHWTAGQPLDLAAASKGHELLVSRDSLALVRRAMELKVDDPRALAHLERWLLSELLTQGLAAESAEVANVEAAATFSLDGREIALRELNRLLLTEKSAVKRRALWAASLKAVERLDAALVRRETKARDLLQSLDAPSPLELAALLREVDPAALEHTADAALTATDQDWRAALEQLAQADVKLPEDKLTRADLPRLLRVAPDVDAAFPRDSEAARAMVLLGDLGLYGAKGLTLDLAESARKSPLPLSVAPGGPADVRLSFRPNGGVRDMASLLSELGVTLALRGASTDRFETNRLGNPGRAEVTAALFAGLLADENWLEDAGVAKERRTQVADAWRIHQLFTLRRAAGAVLLAVQPADASDADLRARYAQVMTRALGVRHTADDGVRLRLDSQDFLRAATVLQVHAQTDALTAQLRALGPRWWKLPASRSVLSAWWARGTSEPPPAAPPPATGAASDPKTATRSDATSPSAPAAPPGQPPAAEDAATPPTAPNGAAAEAPHIAPALDGGR